MRKPRRTPICTSTVRTRNKYTVVHVDVAYNWNGGIVGFIANVLNSVRRLRSSLYNCIMQYRHYIDTTTIITGN